MVYLGWPQHVGKKKRGGGYVEGVLESTDLLKNSLSSVRVLRKWPKLLTDVYVALKLDVRYMQSRYQVEESTHFLFIQGKLQESVCQ